MKVKELIDRLKEFEPEDEIYIFDMEFINYCPLIKVSKEEVVIKRDKYFQTIETDQGVVLRYE